VGPGLAEVDRLHAWENASTSSLFREDEPSPKARGEGLSGYDAAIACTRSGLLATSLRHLVPRVVTRDPSPPAGGGHASTWLAGAAHDLGAGDAGLPPSHEPSPEEREAAERIADPLPEAFLAIHPGSGSPSKNWPPASFAAIVARHASGRRWLLVEGPADVSACDPLRAVPGAVVARGLPPRVLGTLLSRAGLYVGNDSGVSHLAAAWGAPTLTLFGPTDPEVWAPVGVRVVTVRGSGGSVASITLERAERAMGALLAAAGAGPRTG
jgi:hypothetical protein